MTLVEMKPISVYRWGKITCQQTKKTFEHSKGTCTQKPFKNLDEG